VGGSGAAASRRHIQSSGKTDITMNILNKKNILCAQQVLNY
jgi:hypothetical protein